MKRVLSLFLSVLMLLSITAGMDFSALAADTYSINVEGMRNYDKAAEMVKLVNAERAKVGAAPLTMDTGLLDAAMVRAEETSLYFDHDRPDGSSLKDLSKKINGENILLGSSTADNAMEEWMDSWGHRANILNPDFKSIGIGCFNTNTNYWVQCFSYESAGSTSVKKGTESRRIKINMLKSLTQLNATVIGDSVHPSDYFYPGETGSISYGLLNMGTDGRFNSKPVEGDYIFSSSNPSVLEVNAAGILKAKNVGTATITVTHKDYPGVTVSITRKVLSPVVRAETFENSAVITRDKVAGATEYRFLLWDGYGWAAQYSSTSSTEFICLSPGTEYTVIVSALNGDEFIGDSVEISFTTKLPKVTGLYTSARGGYGEKLKIEWNAQNGADSYNIYSYSKTNGWTKAATTKNNYYVFEDVVPGWEYYYKVAAVKNGVEGALSDEHHTCAACPPMDAPTVSLAGSNSIQVDWNIVNSHGYVIQWSTDPTFEKDLNSLYVTGHNWDSYTITTKGNARNYYVRVRAWRNFEGGMVYGLWSSGSKIASDALYPVTGLYTSARGGYGEKLKIEWNAQNGADSYTIYSYSKTNGWSKVASTKNNYYVFENVVPGWEYYYKVAAVKNGVEGALSDQLHTCAACPPMDAPTVSPAGSNSIKVDWNIVNSHGYVIQWSTDSTFSKDLNSLYVTGHGKDSYTITTKSNARNYYVRVRAWRNFEGGMVYGIWSNPAQLG